MASDEVNYLILEYVSIALFLFLFGHCFYRGINYTLQIFCIVAILNNINETVLLLAYDDRVMARAGGSPGCTISAVFEQFLPLAITCLASCMGFHIWFVIVRRSKYTEQQLLKWYCLFSFGMPAIATSIACILLRDWEDLSSYPRKFYCDLRSSNITLGTFAIPMLVVAIPGIICATHSVIFLVLHTLRVRRTLYRSETHAPSLAMDLSHCIRLVIFCLAFGIIVLLAVLEKFGQKVATKDDYSTTDELNNFSDFSGSFAGIGVFLVFGTTKDAVRTMGLVFLPCIFPRRDRNQASSIDLESPTRTSPLMSNPSGRMSENLTFEEAIR
ncbi:hypothetical protein EMPS_06106 [Entomortierella parvispora]|uniref:G-protein coupled receptors family 2 profile 2 domain-containing protein n=1 Tax=Entomortierella parvispora TaxID=205924 RepID=A0A9P3LX52_9FUNG|nr:hypothetical protein EMPS_06106 [Entomortierella parvispora]